MSSQPDLTVTRVRIASIDLLRGLVMIIMALDHARDYFSVTAFSPEDLSQSSSAYFLTRWITHFCAPVFIFLSGTSAWLYRSNRDVGNAELSQFLVSRGLWLVFIEIAVMNVFWQFGYSFVILQVIWAIGCSMIILGLLVFLPRAYFAWIAVVVVLYYPCKRFVEYRRTHKQWWLSYV